MQSVDLFIELGKRLDGVHDRSTCHTTPGHTTSAVGQFLYKPTSTSTIGMHAGDCLSKRHDCGTLRFKLVILAEGVLCRGLDLGLLIDDNYIKKILTLSFSGHSHHGLTRREDIYLGYIIFLIFSSLGPGGY